MRIRVRDYVRAGMYVNKKIDTHSTVRCGGVRVLS